MPSADLSLALHFLEDEPLAAARTLELEPPEQVARLLPKASSLVAAKVFTAMLPSFAAPILVQMPDEQCARLLKELNTADIAAILRHLKEPQRSRQLDFLPLKKQTACQLLLSYPDYTVGAWTETDLLVLDEQMEVQDALLRVKKKTFSDSQQIYVINRLRQVTGSVSVYDLLRSPANQSVHRLMADQPPTLSGFTELSAAQDLAVWHRQDTAAVVNLKHEFIGIIHHHQIRYALSRAEPLQLKDPLPGDILSAYGASLNALLDLLTPVSR
ncbi:magnesium transporter [Bowmanella dokdonensis]|uniref:Magnesium transporter n=1 Tax=Bowmanella dokdonensis TaxID=751969 RepID=A0A939ISK3_9ALTE|nr:magnesium transporter [Bowmanella dokdonensis]MBN7826817.1 magnesium transporter [Bowmanella dokdonensis]